ncbi:phosphate ABC transporter permease PstA [Roseibacterium beibuensis]|uniref:Phosphate transport system permease protein PstA n=1 Tax=[Roseibacterium] beibuensis TaxID=1193142 RepID=A0ABP9L212_9RHOB|nr:phosphate ABC transporter permease PstA [Roseibacterium beibuensis]MCS6621397.1 phosphate ABC transporter permease PstA [Roseibacterium beibuensis]
MTDATGFDAPIPPAARVSLYERSAQVKQRHRKGAALRYLGVAAITLVLFFLAVLLWSIFSRGIPALFQYQAEIEIYYDPEILNPDGGPVTPEEIGDVSLRSGFERGIFLISLKRTLDSAGIDVAQVVADRWIEEAVERLNTVGLSGGAEIIAGAGAPSDGARLLGQTGNTLRAAASALGGDDQAAAVEALETASTALAEAGFAEAAATLAEIAATAGQGALSDAADALTATGYQQALFDAAGFLRQPDQFDDGDLSAIIYAANRRDVRDRLVANPDLVGETAQEGVPIDISVTRYLSGELSGEGQANMPPGFNEAQLAIVDEMVEAGIIDRNFRWSFFTNVYSQNGEVAGIGPALMGSAYMMLVVLVFSLIFGVAASIYLEEFAPKNKITDFIEINIANLAAVPSIVFGILGAAMLFTLTELGFGNSIRGTALLGGLVLSLMTLPTIVIATRAALKAVPPSIRDAALGIGASKVQTVFHHVLPLAAPGILTGTIIGIAQALGETAPLLLIGLSVSTGADILSSPFSGGLLEQAQSMPTVVYLFAQNEDAPVREGLAQAAIIVMLLLLFALNFIAIILRRRFERRW